MTNQRNIFRLFSGTMTKERRNKTKAVPFRKEYHKPIVRDFSSTHKLADCVPKGEKSFIPEHKHFMSCTNSECYKNIKSLGNKYTRDLAEDFPTQRDADSKFVRYEKTHTRRNCAEFSNVTTNLKEYRPRDPNRMEPWPILNHSKPRREAKALGRPQSIPKLGGKIQKEKYDKNMANKKKAKRILEREKNVKKEIKIELPYENERGFRLEDYVKGNFELLTLTRNI